MFPRAPAQSNAPWARLRLHARSFAFWYLGLTALDVSMRYRIMHAWNFVERREYLFCWLASAGFWWGCLVLLGALSRRGGAAWAGFWLVGVTLTALVWVPFSVFLRYGNFPNWDGMIFVANAGGFTLDSLPRFIALPELLLFASLWAALSAVSWKRETSPRGRWVALLGLLGYVGALTVCKVRPTLPLTPEGNSIKFATKLLLWHGNAPVFFELGKRYPPPPPAALRGDPGAYDFLWIVGESFSAQYLHSYGAAQDDAPHLEAVLADPRTVRLERLNSNSSCTDVSVPSLLSGLDPVEPMARYATAELPYDVFKARGDRTFLVSSHKLEWAHLIGFMADPYLDDIQGAAKLHPNPPDDFGAPDTETYAAALEQMDQSEAAGQRFFGVVHTRTLHPPYQTDPAGPPPGLELDNHVPSRRYEASLRYYDRMFGEFFDALQKRPYAAHTIVLFNADHGEAFGQHGISSHCGKYYTEESHIPGFVFAPHAAWQDPVLGPKLAELRANSPEFVSNVDLYPTLLDLAGFDLGALGPQLDGHVLTRPLAPDRRYLFSNCAEFRRCPIRSFGFYQRGLKYIFHADQRRWEVFDEIADPAELHDVAALHQVDISAALPGLEQNQVFAGLLGGGSP